MKNNCLVGGGTCRDCRVAVAGKAHEKGGVVEGDSGTIGDIEAVSVAIFAVNAYLYQLRAGEGGVGFSPDGSTCCGAEIGVVALKHHCEPVATLI